jgi:hypothetical protein
MHTGSYISVLLLPFQLIIAPDQPAHEQLMANVLLAAWTQSEGGEFPCRGRALRHLFVR